MSLSFRLLGICAMLLPYWASAFTIPGPTHTKAHQVVIINDASLDRKLNDVVATRVGNINKLLRALKNQ